MGKRLTIEALRPVVEKLKQVGKPSSSRTVASICYMSAIFAISKELAVWGCSYRRAK
jgi:hypothetical protein